MMTNIKYLLEQIRNRGFVEGANLTEIAKLLETNRNTLNQIVDKIEFFQENYDLPKPEKYDYHNFFIHKIRKKHGNHRKVIVGVRSSNKFKEITGLK